MNELRRRRILAAGGLLGAAFAFPARAAEPAGVDPALLAAAQKEGSVVWYSGLIANQIIRPITVAFEKKYPGIKLQGARMTSSEAALKIMNESRAGRPQADVFDNTALAFRLMDAGMVENYKPEAAKNFPEGRKDPNGAWTALNVYVMTAAYNTDMVAAKDVPKSFKDLLDPKWKGRIAWTNDPTTAGPPGFIGTILTSMGQQDGMAFLKQLAQQKIVNVPASQRVVLDQVIAGQYPLALMTFDYHSVISANQGAPVQWLPLEPVAQLPNPIGLVKNARHPNAAKLFLEYVLSPDGQRVFRDANYLPANPEVPPKDPRLLPEGGHYKYVLITPETTATKLEQWTGIYNELFK